MNVSTNFLRTTLGVALIVILSFISVLAQQSRGTLRGVIKDEFGATIVGATVTITDAAGVKKDATTNNDGAYVFNGLAPGKYSLTAAAAGFAIAEETEIEVAAGQRQTFDVTLQVTIEEQKVTIAAETPLSTEATNNANQTLITGQDLDALPDDPDELAAALQALAGPSMGPNGGQIFVDGFSGGRLPPKESIREIRINQNPFAAENDQASGRIEILTRPGTDKLRGSAFFNFEDESLNSRNPFSDERTAFQVRQYGGNLGGPIIPKKASFFFDFQRRETDDNELVTATILDENLNPLALGFGIVAPRRNLNFSPRFDYQINTNNTLIARYSYSRSSSKNSGVVGFSLPERAYDTASTQQSFSVTETAILNASMINETRFQVNRNRNESFGDNTIPVLNVSGAFVSGGSQVGQVLNSNTSWELQNFLAWQRNNHSFKFGGRVRGVRINDSNPNNFGGSYFFTGGLVPVLDTNNQIDFGQAPIFADSLERYRRTIALQRAGFDALEIRKRGGGAAQFSIATGDPLASVSQMDVGFYAQDDWRVRPNLTLGLGIRYENQTNISSKFNFAPRVFMAWSPGATDSARPPSMVIRAGAGIFYNRFGEFNTLNANRFNGVNQQSFSASEAPLYRTVNGVPTYVAPTALTALDAFDPTDLTKLPALSELTPARQITWRVSDDLQAPRVYVAGVQVERQLPYRFTMFAGFYSIHVRNVIRALDINAPLPGSITNATPDGSRPFGNIGEIYQYESTGKFDQNQFFVGFNNRLNRTVSFSSSYSMSKSKNDTDGQGNGIFPVNHYDLSGEYSRAGFDVRHRFNFFGSINLPWQVSLNPLITYSSGRPFNIITGQDTNLDRLFTERPSFAPDGVDCNLANIRCTRFGNFNLTPAPGEALIPRNFGEGPGYFALNMRVSKTWNFGSMPSARAAAPAGQQPGQAAGNTRGPGGGTPRIPNAGGGGRPQGGGGGPQRGGGGIPGGGLGAGSEAKRYSMVFSLNFNNLLNKVNLSNPNANLSSPSFGESQSLGGSFGGFGGFGGGSTGAGNRRVTAQVRFSF
ncbi:MAG TPA: carboxypeptidase regulatory-like domain-containing protein [Pyrinomonadaceae bacterium]|nr:carboxypeptidase regulatory-like domain-containing protein [Pyrinomonadaceae bacterium]